MIEKEQAEIKEQIEGLFTQKNDEHDRRENKTLNRLAILSVLEVADLVGTFFFDGCGWSDVPFIPWIKLGLLIATGIGFYAYYEKKRD